MTSGRTPPRSVATPLDAASAENRSKQIAAIAEPTRLRVLSVLVANSAQAHTEATVAEDLDISIADAADHLQRLVRADLITVDESEAVSSYRPTADAWVRFGRLVAPVEQSSHPAAASTAGVGNPGLPPVIDRISDQLSYRFSSYFSPETVRKYVTDSYLLLAERSRVTRHLPSLTSRFASDRLGALASSRGLNLRGTPEVLFVCVQNAGRSQIAAGLLRQLAGDRVHVRTAGSVPASSIDALVAEVLEEIGVPVVSEFPKPLTDEVVQASDFVITMGCGDACPVYPGRRYMDWPIDDPVGLPIEQVRVIRDEIQSRVQQLLDNEIGLAVR